MTANEVFARNLKQYMEKFGENQTDLARHLGCLNFLSLICHLRATN